MARRNVFLIVGPDIPQADTLHDHLAQAEVLTAARLAVPAVDAEDLVRSGIEILRTHRAHGLRRKQVEGTWARVCRRAWKAKKDTIVVAPGLAQANREQVALALDTLSGLRVHVVGTRELPDWQQAVKPGRFHVVPVRERDEFVASVVRIAEASRVVSLEDRIIRLGRGPRKAPSSAGRLRPLSATARRPRARCAQ